MPYSLDGGGVAPLVVERATAGDREAFTRLVTAYHHDLLRLCFTITGDVDLSSDAAQAAWQHAWRKLSQLRDPSRIRSWLLTIAANEARQALRRRGRVITVPHGLVDPPAPQSDRVGMLDLSNALGRLRADERQLIALRYVSGFNSNELAEAMGMSPAGVRTRLKRILDRLRRELDDG